MGMDEKVCCYNIGEGFDYPDEASLHLIGEGATHS